MYIWKLAPVLTAEMGITNFVKKAKKAKLSSLWIKIAEGNNENVNITGNMRQEFINLCQKLKETGINVWGWHIPFCKTGDDASKEAALVARLIKDFNLDGAMMDAESEPIFFKGNETTADIYAGELRTALNGQQKGLALSSHDIPSNFPDFPFNTFAKYASVNAPQVYYGQSTSVEKRLNNAIRSNSHLPIPFIPVGAGWIGDGTDGGCSSASACAERAVSFMNLNRRNGFQGYSFWHWQGAPSKLWEVLFTEPV
jgi:hypothetical protein